MVNFKYYFFVFTCCAFASHAVMGKEAKLELVADINQTLKYERNFHPKELLTYQGDIYFSADSPIYGKELYRKQTGQAPQLAADILEGAASSSPYDLKVFNDNLYFIAITEDGHQRLWQYPADGEPSQVTGLSVGEQSLSVQGYLLLGEELWIVGKAENKQNGPLQVWRRQGQETLPELLDTLIDSSAEVIKLFAFNNHVYLFTNYSSEEARCVFRRYSANGDIRAIPCNNMAYMHQAVEFEEQLYITGVNDKILVFDGESAPIVSLDGQQLGGQMLTLGDYLYIAGNGEATLPDGGYIQGTKWLYRYRPQSGLEKVPLPDELAADHLIMEMSLATRDNMLYVKQISGRFDEDWWPLEQMLYRYDPAGGEAQLLVATQATTYPYAFELEATTSERCSNLDNVLNCEQDGSFTTYGADNSQINDSASPRMLTVAGEKLYFQADDGELNNSQLWALEAGGTLHQLDLANFQQIIPFGEAVAVLSNEGYVYLVDGQGQISGLDDLYPDFDGRVYQMTTFSDKLYLLGTPHDGPQQLWSYDGVATPLLLGTLEHQGNVFRHLLVTETAVLLYQDSQSYWSADGVCRIWQFPFETTVLEPWVEQSMEEGSDIRCRVKLFELQEMVYYAMEFGEYQTIYPQQSTVGRMINGQAVPIWENQPWSIDLSSFTLFQDRLYLCLAENGLRQDRHLHRLAANDEPHSMAVTCLNRGTVANLDGRDKLYLVGPPYANALTDSLFVVNEQGELSSVNAIGSEYIQPQSTPVLFAGDLYFNADFRSATQARGEELVRLTTVNQPVSFVLDEQTNQDVAADTPQPLGQLLAVIDADDSDNLSWVELSPPAHGQLTGLPLILASDGQTQYPDGIFYHPKAGFIGQDSFSVKVSDGLTQDTLMIMLNFQSTEPEPTPPEDSSGGSLTFWQLLLLVFWVVRSRHWQR